MIPVGLVSLPCITARTNASRIAHIQNTGTIPRRSGEGKSPPVTSNSGLDGKKNNSNNNGIHPTLPILIPSFAFGIYKDTVIRKRMNDGKILCLSLNERVNSHRSPSAEITLCNGYPKAENIHDATIASSIVASNSTPTIVASLLLIVRFQIVNIKDMQLQRTNCQTGGIHTHTLPFWE